MLDNTLYEIPRGCIQIILDDFNTTIGREECFKPIIEGHELSNYNGCRLKDLAKGKNIWVKSTMFSHKKLHKGTWSSRDGRHVNQIDHGLVNERFNNSILDVRTVRGTDGDSDHFLVPTSEVKKKTRNKERRRHRTV